MAEKIDPEDEPDPELVEEFIEGRKTELGEEKNVDNIKNKNTENKERTEATEIIQIYVSESLQKKIRVKAAIERNSMSGFIRNILQKKLGDWEPEF